MEAARQYLSHIDAAGGRPVVAGTRMRVSQIASETERHGMTPGQIVEAHPHLTLADVHAALTYFYDHRDAIQQEWAEEDALVAEMKAQHPNPDWLNR